MVASEVFGLWPDDIGHVFCVCDIDFSHLRFRIYSNWGLKTFFFQFPVKLSR